MVQSFVTKWYPRATEDRLFRADAPFKKTRTAFLKASGKNFLYLQVIFLGVFCWLFGSLYLQETHIKNLHIAFVDYDNNGSIGQAVLKAYSSLQSIKFPTLIEVSPTTYPNPSDLREAVCKIHYWGAIYVLPGASARLERALAGNLTTAAYDPSKVMSYIWNEARYPTVVDQGISSNLQTLAQTARVAFSTADGTGHITSLTNPSAIAAIANPWTLNSINIQPTTQGTRVVYNTLVIILIMIQQFFYLGIINSLYAGFKIYNRASPYRIIMIRNMNSLAYTFVGSLCASGAIWAFKHTWHVNHAQWVLTWMSLWLFAHLNFLAMDVLSIWLQPAFVPLALIFWISFNVTSILLPFELSAGFYKIGYSTPAHGVYELLIDVWSGGCNNQLRVSLPVMFAWWMAGFLLSCLGVFRRCHYATVAQEEQDKLNQERVHLAALELARERGCGEDGEPLNQYKRKKSTATSAGRKKSTATASGTGENGEGAYPPHEIEKVQTSATGTTDREEASTDDDEAVRGDSESQLSQAMSRISERIRRQQSKASRVEYGPAFGMPFGADEDEDDSK